MRKALFGMAAGFALAGAPAWAGDEEVDERRASGTVATTDGGTGSSGDVRPRSTPGAASVVHAGRDGGVLEETAEARASRDPEYDEDRWMREPENPRGGGR